MAARQAQPQLHRVVPSRRHSGQVSPSGTGSGSGSASACVHCFMIARLRRVCGRPRGKRGRARHGRDATAVAGGRQCGDRGGRPAHPGARHRCCWSRSGLAVSYVPGVPDYTLDPDVVLPLLLPPLLYTAAIDSSYLDLRAKLRPVALLSVGYVLFATVRRRLGRLPASCPGCR